MLDPSTFQYLNPTQGQKDAMEVLRKAAANYYRLLDQELPDGPDKTHIIRKFREVAMWVNVCLTRHADGSPRLNGKE